MKTRTMKSILSMILSLTLAMGLMTSTVFATDIEELDPDPETVEDIIEDDEQVSENTEEETELATEQPYEEEDEAVPAEESEDEEENPGIQLFASTDENQTLKVEQKADGTIGDDVSFTYHLYQILEAAETIENMGDIIKSEPGADLDYVICDADGNETSSGTTDSEGTFELHVGETAEFTLEAETNWFVNQDTPEAYPLLSVKSDGDYAGVVDSTNGVVYYGQIEPVITGLTVTSDMEEEDNTKTYDGEKITLTAEVSYVLDGATVSYQWYKDGEEISGATMSIIVLNDDVADSGTYKCVVTVENDDRTASAEAEITITINKAAQDISYGQSTVTKIDYDEDFTNGLTQTVVHGQITYASSDESVATVDPDTGEVTIVGTGFTTITATAAETDNYKEATASYVLTVNEDVVEWEIDVNNDRVTWDEEHEEWVDDLTYTGEPLELEMAITLTAEEQEELVEITYQWYRFNDGTQDFDEIEGATGETYTLAGDDVNAGDYIYMCMAVVTYKSGYEHTVYGAIEVIIEKVPQDISYEETEIEKTMTDEAFTNPLTVTLLSPEDGAGITYTSSDETVATVDEDGKVTILAVGEATITATAAETANYAEATASYTIVVTDYTVKYAVTIYGINQDVDENENTLGLTFGPATGASYISTYKAHLKEEQYDDGEGICLHWMSWEEIIEQCAEDPEAFEACLENGCTHSVNLTLNDTLLATDYSGQMDDGDGAGYLYNSINSNYRMWNSSAYNTGGWPASQVRAVFNGKDDQTGSYATYALDASDCLFSCFPSVLQDAIAARAVKSDTVYNSQTEENNKTTYDKLWLFSGKELYADSGSNNSVIRTYEGELYQRSTALGITTSNSGGLRNYNETGGNSTWWLRSPYTSNSNDVYYVYASGDWTSYDANDTAYGLAPGFCLK